MGRRSTNPVFQQFELLATGYGYNFYDKKELARADDQLIRQKACGFLSEAAEHLASLAVEYQKAHVPPATRDHPYPPAEAMAELENIKTLKEHVSKLEVQIRSMRVPVEDRIWDRYFNQETILPQLLDFDQKLISGAQALLQGVRDLDGSTWNAGSRFPIGSQVKELSDVAHDRERILSLPG